MLISAYNSRVKLTIGRESRQEFQTASHMASSQEQKEMSACVPSCLFVPSLISPLLHSSGPPPPSPMAYK